MFVELCKFLIKKQLAQYFYIAVCRNVTSTGLKPCSLKSR